MGILPQTGTVGASGRSRGRFLATPEGRLPVGGDNGPESEKKNLRPVFFLKRRATVGHVPRFMGIGVFREGCEAAPHEFLPSLSSALI